MKGIVVVFKRPDAAEGNEARIELIPTALNEFRLVIRDGAGSEDIFGDDDPFFIPRYALVELKDQILIILASGGTL